MARSYHEPQLLETTDLLTALKYSMNYEAELYMDGRMISCPLGWEHEYLAEIIEPLGIKTSYLNNRLHFEYKDVAKKSEKLYVQEYAYNHEGSFNVSISVHDYRQSNEDVEFDTMDEVRLYFERKYMDADKMYTSAYLDNSIYSATFFKDRGWFPNKYYIVGIFDSFVPPWLCIGEFDADAAVQKYIELQKEKLFEDQYDLIKVQAVSPSFVYGEDGLHQYAKENPYTKEIRKPFVPYIQAYGNEKPENGVMENLSPTDIIKRFERIEELADVLVMCGDLELLGFADNITQASFTYLKELSAIDLLHIWVIVHEVNAA